VEWWESRINTEGKFRADNLQFCMTARLHNCMTFN
jgi:hypothetical protein